MEAEQGTLTMPSGHSQQELELARELAHTLDLRELHVFWSPPRAPRRESPPLPTAIRALAALGSAIERLGRALEPRGRRLI